MATYVSRPAWEVRGRALAGARVAVPLGLGALVAVSLLLRSQVLDVGFWIDEALSVGIADRPLWEIPGVLRLDGSPPLYYVLLNVWMAIAGRSEEATHWLSLIFALLAIPVAWGAGRVLFGPKAAWMAAVLAAVNPFLTQYAQETRMYSLVILLGLCTCATFGRALALPEGAVPAPRRWLAGFSVSLAASMYTHNWALFLALACGATWLVLLRVSPEPSQRRRLLRDGLIGFGGAGLLYLPWVPTLIYQSAHTGAPWAQAPRPEQLVAVPGALLGPIAQVVLLLIAGAGLATVLGARGERPGPARVVGALLGLWLGTVLVAWLVSQLAPAWAFRYLAIALAPLLLLGAGGLAYAGRLGVAGLAIVALWWATDEPPPSKSNVREVAAAIAPSLRPGDTVVSTQPEQISALAYYLPEGLRYATLTGPVADVGITDWRDGVDRLRATSAGRHLEPVLDAMPRGRRLVLVQPFFYDLKRWRAPWTALVRRRSQEWSQHISNDARFRVSAIYPQSPYPLRPVPVGATVFVKTSAR